MTEISPVIVNLAHRNQAQLLRCLGDVTQRSAAELIGVSETTLSEWKNAHVERFCALAAACGLRLVPVTDRSIDDEHLRALETLAGIALRHGIGERRAGYDNSGSREPS